VTDNWNGQNCPFKGILCYLDNKTLNIFGPWTKIKTKQDVDNNKIKTKMTLKIKRKRVKIK